jgi:hypothetical protein
MNASVKFDATDTWGTWIDEDTSDSIMKDDSGSSWETSQTWFTADSCTPPPLVLATKESWRIKEEVSMQTNLTSRSDPGVLRLKCPFFKADQPEREAMNRQSSSFVRDIRTGKQGGRKTFKLRRNLECLDLEDVEVTQQRGFSKNDRVSKTNADLPVNMTEYFFEQLEQGNPSSKTKKKRYVGKGPRRPSLIIGSSLDIEGWESENKRPMNQRTTAAQLRIPATRDESLRVLNVEF